MYLKNIVIVANDMERAKQFYRELFGLRVTLEQDANVMLTGGLVLQEKEVWEKHLGRTVMPKNNAGVLYFEGRELEVFVEKLEALYPETEYVTRLALDDQGRKVLRFYDPDGNLIEVRSCI